MSGIPVFGTARSHTNRPFPEMTRGPQPANSIPILSRCNLYCLQIVLSVLGDGESNGSCPLEHAFYWLCLGAWPPRLEHQAPFTKEAKRLPRWSLMILLGAMLSEQCVLLTNCELCANTIPRYLHRSVLPCCCISEAIDTASYSAASDPRHHLRSVVHRVAGSIICFCWG